MIDIKKRTLWGLSGGHFILDMYAAILIPLYPIIAARLNINIAQISLVIALGHAIASILQPLFGHISDRLNKRFFMFWGLILASVFVPLGYIAPNAIFLTLCLILGMAGNAFYHPQTTTIIKDYFKENTELAKAIGIFLGLGTIGYAFAPYLSTFVVQVIGDDKYIFLSLIGIIVAFILLFFVPKMKEKAVEKEADFKGAIKEILSNKLCLFLIFITVIKAALVMSYGTYIPFLLKEHGFKITHIGLIVTLFYIAGGVSMLFSGTFERILKLKGMIIASFAPLLPLTIASIVSLNYSRVLSSILYIVTGFFVLFSAGVVLAYAQQIVSKAHTGTISGIIQGFTLALGALLLIPFGAIAQSFGVSVVLILVTTIALISSLFALKIRI